MCCVLFFFVSSSFLYSNYKKFIYNALCVRILGGKIGYNFHVNNINNMPGWKKFLKNYLLFSYVYKLRVSILVFLFLFLESHNFGNKSRSVFFVYCVLY